MPPQTDGHQRIPQVSSACRMRIRAVAGQRAAAVARGWPLPSHLRQRSARRIKAPVTCRAPLLPFLLMPYNCHRLSGLKQHKCITLQYCGLEVRRECHRANIMASAGSRPFLKLRGESVPLPCLTPRGHARPLASGPFLHRQSQQQTSLLSDPTPILTSVSEQPGNALQCLSTYAIG